MSADPGEVTARGLFCFSSRITNIISLLSAGESDRSACLLGRSEQGQLCASAGAGCTRGQESSVTSMVVFDLMCSVQIYPPCCQELAS